MPEMNTKARALDFANLVNVMSVYAEAKARLAALENEAQSAFIDLVDERKSDYAAFQQKISETELAIEVIARANPDWFRESKTVKTPFGSVSLRKTTSLNVANEELTIVLIEQRIAEELAAQAEAPSEAFLRTRKELDLEALEKLDDADLKRLRITRTSTENCTIKTAKVDLGKAVKASNEEETKGGK